MSESKKFNEEELKKIKDIQLSYQDTTNKFGQISITRLRLEQQQESLEKEHDALIQIFNKTQEDEQKFLDSITEKYGQGTLNPETGVFVPTESKNKSE